MNLTALVPAHNEEAIIGSAIDGLLKQTRVPDRIIVVSDNSSDRTVEIAHEYGVEVFETTNNTHKKAGALNQVLDTLSLTDGFVFIQDADSIIEPEFLENALAWFEKKPKLGAVGGTFRAIPLEGRHSLSERILWRLQDNEYARYQRDVERLRGKCLVVTGTAAMFKAATLAHVRAERGSALPMGGGGVYDTTVLTEDNEISFALMHLGYTILAPHDCLLTTDAMTTVRDLYNQRLRWKRGAIENCVQYGLTKVTLPYWGRQMFTMLGVLVTGIYLCTLAVALFVGINLSWFWCLVTLIFVAERFVTVNRKGLREQLLASTMWEVPYEMFLQGTHADAYFRAAFRLKKEW